MKCTACNGEGGFEIDPEDIPIAAPHHDTWLTCTSCRGTGKQIQTSDQAPLA